MLDARIAGDPQTCGGLLRRPEQRPQQLRDAGTVRRDDGVRGVQADDGEPQDPGALLQRRRPRRGLCNAQFFWVKLLGLRNNIKSSF